ncbi:hypothetical protein MTO96_048916 [Rhipicephalus appendiculatus]
MADVHSEDSDNSSSKQASATVSSRLSAPRKSPVALTLTRACKVKGAIKRSQPIAGTPTSRPRTRGTAKLPATRQRKALQNKATSTGKTQESAATTSGEDATAITPVLRPATLHFVPKEADATLLQGEEQPKEGAPRTEETKEQGQKQTSVLPPPPSKEGSDGESSSSSSSPSTSSSWEHTTPPSSPSSSTSTQSSPNAAIAQATSPPAQRASPMAGGNPLRCEHSLPQPQAPEWSSPSHLTSP